jgi:thioredoxin reductase
MRYSSRVAPDYGYLVEFLKGQLRKLNVDVRAGAVAEATAIKAERPDAVVLATGALGGLCFFQVVGRPQTFDLFAAFERPEPKWEGEKVVIAGGDSESCFLALYLARRGADIDVVEPKSGFSSNKAAPGRDLLMTQVEKMPNIRLRAQTTVEEAGDGYVILQSLGRLERVSGVHTVVIGGRVANNALYEQLMESGADLNVYRIGDSVVPHDVYRASQDAADVAELISLRSNQSQALAR